MKDRLISPPPVTHLRRGIQRRRQSEHAGQMSLRKSLRTDSVVCPLREFPQGSALTARLSAVDIETAFESFIIDQVAECPFLDLLIGQLEKVFPFSKNSTVSVWVLQ